jgi:hypothetical protein
MSATTDIKIADDVLGAHSPPPVVRRPSNVLNLYAGVGGNRKLWQGVNEQRLKRQGMLFNHDGKCGKITL